MDGLVGISGPSVHLLFLGLVVAGGLQIPWPDVSILTCWSPLPVASGPNASFSILYAFFFPEPMKASLFSIIAAHRYEHCR